MKTSKQWGDDSDNEKSEKICRFFNSFRGCKKGDECNFVHEQLPCAFFASEQGCTYNDRCPFSHDMNNISNVHLKQCPNDNCQNQCIGRQCMQCHNIMDRVKQPKNTRRPRQRFVPYTNNNNINNSTRYDRPTHICPVPNCENMCTGRICRDCHQKKKSYY